VGYKHKDMAFVSCITYGSYDINIAVLYYQHTNFKIKLNHAMSLLIIYDKMFFSL